MEFFSKMKLFQQKTLLSDVFPEPCYCDECVIAGQNVLPEPEIHLLRQSYSSSLISYF